MSRPLPALLLCSALSAGCANNVYSFSYTPINKQYADQLIRVTPGMSKAEVRTLLPKIAPRGQNAVDGRVIEALELEHHYWNGIGGELVDDRLWFYFYDNKLVKWGRPDDWPVAADIIIEHR